MASPRRTRVQDYLVAIELACSNADRAATGAIAREIGVSTGTTSSVLKILALKNLIDLVPYEGAKLTELGRSVAGISRRRYRLIEMFLLQTLGIDEATASYEAWLLEPAVSERLMDLMDAALNHPQLD